MNGNEGLKFNRTPLKITTPGFHWRSSRIVMATWLILTVFILFISSSASAQTEGGPKTVSGRVYTSSGTLVDEEHNGALVELHIIHGGEESIYLDYNGLEKGWYSITIEPGGWSQGDLYWIEVDGRDWGDIRGRAVEKNDANITEWRMVGPGSHQLDIRTVKPVIVEDDDEINLEPEAAFLCGIIILITGMYLVGPSKKVNVDVIVISSRSTGGTDKTNDPRNIEYEFGYGNPSSPIPIGKLQDLDEQLSVNSVVRVRVRGIIRNPDGYYSWYKPELLGLEKADESPLLAPDSVADLDKLWYATGSVTVERGQSLKSSMRDNYSRNLAVLTIPLVAFEFIIGLYSYFYDYPTIPPLIGEALIFNVTLIIIGIIAPLAAASFGSRVKGHVESSKKSRYTIRQWAILTGDRGQEKISHRVDFCGSCGVKIDSGANTCPSCNRSFISSLEITPEEAKKLLGKAPKEDVKKALPPAQVPAQPVQATPDGQAVNPAQPNQPTQITQLAQPQTAQPASPGQPTQAEAAIQKKP